ncbi:hypothetical protein Cob_v009542 [Colletotrichum orbiculare MAFF 240422]|uniref:Uncharacterized protein n=1 Tax=Colletotrichum orbiculare (strain 104-T / ATCC 96160 / CBS 514.97 / LARS 414 / MAFF 240422) TaxID=1213857 RepID=A0A484FHH3_COLOR|nr:hypothetical protein Cob_v009542 [Colletotrichum orbiculare MAFF 240422]
MTLITHHNDLHNTHLLAGSHVSNATLCSKLEPNRRVQLALGQLVPQVDAGPVHAQSVDGALPPVAPTVPVVVAAEHGEHARQHQPSAWRESGESWLMPGSLDGSMPFACTARDASGGMCTKAIEGRLRLYLSASSELFDLNQSTTPSSTQFGFPTWLPAESFSW